MMVKFVFALLMISFGIKRITSAKIDAAQTNNGSITNVSVFQLTAGTIKSVDSAHQMRLLLLIEQLASARVPLLTSLSKQTLAWNVMPNQTGYLIMTKTSASARQDTQMSMELALSVFNAKIMKSTTLRLTNAIVNQDSLEMELFADHPVLQTKFGMENFVFVLLELLDMEHARSAQMDRSLMPINQLAFARVLVKFSL